MKNVLILASGYCGKATANGLCAQALAAELERNSMCVYVVSCDAERVDMPQGKVMSVQRVPVNKGQRKSISAKIWYRIKNCLCYTWTPNYEKKTVKKMIKAANDVCERVHIDAIVCMYFPLEAVVAGQKLKQKYPHLKFMIYELDSVADGIAGGNKRDWRVLFSNQRILKSLYKQADTILLLKCHKAYWLKKYQCFQEKMQLVDLPILQRPNFEMHGSDSSCVQFLYSGALSAWYRSPVSMLSTLGSLGSTLAWRLDFYSKGCEDTLSSACEKDDRITCHGYVQQSVLEEAVSRADVLLSIGNRFSNSLPSKIITYMTYGKPIVHFCLQENDVCKEYLEKYPLALVIDIGESAESGAQRIVEFIKLTRGKSVSFEELSVTFPMNLPAYSVKTMIESLQGKEF